jgi:hypothetical protein
MPDSKLMMHLGISFALTCVILPGVLEDHNIRTDSVLAIPVFLILGVQTWVSYLICCIAVHTLFELFITSLFECKRK